MAAVDAKGGGDDRKVVVAAFVGSGNARGEEGGDIGKGRHGFGDKTFGFLPFISIGKTHTHSVGLACLTFLSASIHSQP